MKKQTLFSIFSVISLLTTALIIDSCKKAESIVPLIEDIKQLPDLMSYYKFVSRKTDGIIGIRSTKNWGNSSEAGGNEVATGVIFESRESVKRIDVGTLLIGNLKLTADPAQNYMYGGKDYHASKEMFGKMLRVELIANKNFNIKGQAVTSFIDSLYIPTDIYMLTPNRNISTGYLDRNENFQVTWNPDVKNENGVIVAFQYLTTLAEDPERKEVVQYAKVVPDNGSFTIDASVFQKVPPRRDVVVTILRGNYKIYSETISESEYSLYGVTDASASLITK